MEKSLNETLMIVASNLTIAYFQREQSLLSKINSAMDLDRNSIQIIPEIYGKLLENLKNNLSSLQNQS